LNHGAGGRQSHDLISIVFAAAFGMPMPLTDSAIIEDAGNTLAFTTDSYVVDPVFFPGGDIGKLAICGTVNDLAVSGAIPKYISASFIIEEGFPVVYLRKIVESMAAEAREAGVKIITGDTKVVEKGKCDHLFITTSGIGMLHRERAGISAGKKVAQGDKLIINGSLGNHAIAVLGSRNSLSFTTPVISDCAHLNHLINKVLEKCKKVNFMRDLTRGGLSGVLNELASICEKGISIDESSIPVDDPVRGACEMLGFDPLYLANEGKFLIVSASSESEEILSILKSDPLGKNSAIIGEIAVHEAGRVVLKTLTGGKRILDTPSGNQLPRIC
jgi:hydrogenase expression/formation protein HypE